MILRYVAFAQNTATSNREKTQVYLQRYVAQIRKRNHSLRPLVVRPGRGRNAFGGNASQ